MNDFDGFVLAAIQEGAKSGYAIRLRLDAFDLPRWSSESGSSYRVLRRLEKKGLIKEEARLGVPNRERVEYILTDPGRREMHQWITRGPENDLSCLVDTCTYHMEFLEVLDPSERRATVRSWIRNTQGTLKSLRARTHAQSSFAEKAVLMSYVEHCKARERWLKDVLELLPE